MTHTHILLLLLVISHYTVVAQHNLEKKGIMLTRQDNDYTVDFKLTAFSVNNQNVSKGEDGSETFTFINIPEYGITYEEGKPQLPQVSFFSCYTIRYG
ncbi:MAG: hypothetical protein LBV47_03545 [Bacteroidales bacterium]|jgi:hypothetical protein|nr:hypothetical protein [Bacteroidales bacterium]